MHSPVLIFDRVEPQQRTGIQPCPWRRCASIAVSVLVVAGSNAVAQTGVANPSASPRERPESGGPEFPGVQPGPLPPGNLALPAPPPAVVAPSLANSPRFVLRKVDIIGNTVIDDASIRAVVAPISARR